MDLSGGRWGFYAWVWILAFAKWLDRMLKQGRIRQYQADRFVIKIGTVLPCTGCRFHYARRVKRYEPGRTTIYEWFLHVRRAIQRSRTYVRDPRKHKLPAWVGISKTGHPDPSHFVSDPDAVERALFVFVYSILIAYDTEHIGVEAVVDFLNAFDMPLEKKMPGYDLFASFRENEGTRWTRVKLFAAVDQSFVDRGILKRGQRHRRDMVKYFLREDVVS